MKCCNKLHNSCFKDTQQSLNCHAKDRLAQCNRHATQIKGKISSLDHAHKTMHIKSYVHLTRLLLFLDTRQSKTLWAAVCRLHQYELTYFTYFSASCNHLCIHCMCSVISASYLCMCVTVTAPIYNYNLQFHIFSVIESRVHMNNCIVVDLSSVTHYYLFKAVSCVKFHSNPSIR